MAKKGLGRGLDALFSIYSDDDEEEVKPSVLAQKPAKQPVEAAKVLKPVEAPSAATAEKASPKAAAPRFEALPNRASDGIMEIDIKLIDPNKEQPRKSFDATSIKELAESIKLHGVIQPIVVNENKGRYMIIAGERRFRASIVAGKRTIPCIIKSYTDKEVREISLIENLQREDLNVIEAARAIKQLMEEYSFTQETVADRIGKSRPAIANTLRLLLLTPEVVAMVENNKLSAGHARCLVTVSDKALQIDLARAASDNKMTVRDLEKAVKEQSIGGAKTKRPEYKEQSLELKDLINNMQRVFATKVTALGNDRRGRIYIDYYSRDDLDRLAEFIDKLKKDIDVNKK